MLIPSIIKAFVSNSFKKLLKSNEKGTSPARIESNSWLRNHCKSIKGSVLSIGSADDSDGQDDHYRNYFSLADRYTTSEVSNCFDTDLVLDVRSMPEITDGTYDCIYCSGVLEHVDEFLTGFREITRILKPGGILLLGLPFAQALHQAPYDFWRFTEFGIKHLLKTDYEIMDLSLIDTKRGNIFPSAYWVKAVKLPKT